MLNQNPTATTKPTPRPVFYDNDADMSVLSGKTVAVIGYGAQGRAQARMMHQSGVNVVVGLRPTGKSWAVATADGLVIRSVSEAVQMADIVHILIPDETQKEVYDTEIAPFMTKDKIMSFSHGFNIVYKQILPPANMGVIMVAPKAPGTEEYKVYQEGFGVPALFSVRQENETNTARSVAMAMCKAMYFTKAGIMEATFEEETYEDLFGEQAVLCGGLTELIKAGFDTLVEAGYPEEFAYFECLHEAKLIVDLLYQGGTQKMWEVVSNTAEYGGQSRAKRIITDETRAEMKKILKEVESGEFAEEYLQEMRDNKMAKMLAYRKAEGDHQLEITGTRIRSMFKKMRD